jgi:hypothetical protein
MIFEEKEKEKKCQSADVLSFFTISWFQIIALTKNDFVVIASEYKI